MTRINLFRKISVLIIVIIFNVVLEYSSALSDKRLCYDPECSERVSIARTTITYTAGEKGMLSVPLNSMVTVYSKGAGKRPDLWGVEYNGKRGYLPKNLLREYKVIQKNLTYEVPIDIVNNNNGNKEKENNNVNNNDSDLKDILSKSKENKPDSTSQYSSPSNINIDASVSTFDGMVTEHVIDGTTIFEANEPSTQSSYDSAAEFTAFPYNKQVESNIYSSIKPTATQMKLGTNITPNKLHQETDFKKLEPQAMAEDKVNSLAVELELKQEKDNKTFSTHELIHEEKENNINFATSDSEDKKVKDDVHSSKHNEDHKKEENNIKSSIVEVEYENTKGNIDSSTVELRDKEENININSSNLESRDKMENDGADSSILRVEHKEQVSMYSANIESEHSNDKDNVVSSTGIKEDDKKEKDLEFSITALGQDKKENNVLSLTAESEHKNEIEISNITVEQTSDMNTLLHKPELEKQVEVESEERILKEKITHNGKEEVQQFVAKDNVLTRNLQNDVCDYNPFKKDEVCRIVTVQKQTQITLDVNNQMKAQDGQMNIVNNDVQNVDIIKNISSSLDVPMESKPMYEDSNEKLHSKNDEILHSSQNDADVISQQIFHEFRGNRNLLHVEEEVVLSKAESEEKNIQNGIDDLKTDTLPEYENIISTKDKVLSDIEDKDIVEEDVLYNKDVNDPTQLEESALQSTVINNMQFSDVCTANNDCANDGDDVNYGFISQEKEIVSEGSIMKMIKVEHTYWVTLLYLTITAITTLVFSLGYYYIENMRRDSKLIAKINKLEKELLLSTKECLTLDENLKLTKEKLNCIQDESFGSNEMVLSLKADLEASQNVKAELEDQVAMLEKDLESATEAGLELERMLREVLSSNNEVNPLAQSVEDLQARLDAQQSANESLTNALNIKTQENEALSVDLAAMKKKYEEVSTELVSVTENFQAELNKKNKIQEDLNNIIEQLEGIVQELTMEKTNLCKELQIKEAEVKDLVEVINQINSNNLDIEKLYEVSHIKAESLQLLEERDELKIRLSEVEGAHNLLEEHMKVVKEEVSALSEQCKLAEKEKRDAETRLEVISNFFKEKEAQRQKEEALWLQKQGEVMSTVERIHTMQNEIQGYKQQIEVLKREIVDQEREYKSHISALETKAHEQWVMARQNERRLEESKVEAGQLRNRLTLIEKNLNDADADTKLHRLDANGETTTSPPLFIGAESSSSPIMFTGSSGVPLPPPPSFIHPSLFPTYLPPPLPSASGLPPYDVGQRLPPLGGRLSSPPPLPLHPPPSGRYENADSPPPLMSPPLPPLNHRSHPPPFTSDHMYPTPLPPPGSILLPPLGTSHSWGEETLPPPRNSGYHPHQREQRAHNHKGSLHSSGESLDKSHHSGKV